MLRSWLGGLEGSGGPTDDFARGDVRLAAPHVRIVARGGGADSAYTKAQIGHRSAKLTLEVYTDVGNRRHSANERVGALLQACEVAPSGTRTTDDGPVATDGGVSGAAETAYVQA
jgi:hypothetical protein